VDKSKYAEAADPRREEALRRAQDYAARREAERRRPYPLRVLSGAVESILDTIGVLALVLLPFYLLYHVVRDTLWLISLLP
jgi:hypothetical protein